MKNKLIFLILVVLSTGCYAQNKYLEGLSKVNGEQFQITYSGPDNDFIVVYNVKSKYSKRVTASDNPRAQLVKREDFHFDKPAVKAIIQQVLKTKKQKLDQNEDFVHIEFVFEPSGKLADISYGVEKRTLISLDDLAEIDARLRKSINATFTGNAFKDYKFLSYSYGTIRFK